MIDTYCTLKSIEIIACNVYCKGILIDNKTIYIVLYCTTTFFFFFPVLFQFSDL